MLRALLRIPCDHAFHRARMCARPQPVSAMDEDTHEVVADALNMRDKSSEGALDDIKEAFDQIPREQIEHAAAVCRDLGNEAFKAGKHEEAAERMGFQRGGWSQESGDGGAGAHRGDAGQRQPAPAQNGGDELSTMSCSGEARR